MRTIICGGRNYILTPEDYGRLETLRDKIPISEVVSGGAKGADICGREWAEGLGIPVREFFAQWKIYGRSAGPIRNTVMARYAQACIAFPGGKGTEDMVRKAKAAGLLILDLRKEK